MILDTPEHLFQSTSSPVWKEAEGFYRSSASLAPGKYELRRGVFAMVQEGITSPVTDGYFEAHREYIDLQIVTQGEELLVWSGLDALSEIIPYDGGKDAAFFSGDGTCIEIRPGQCYVMHPFDGHKACCHKKQAAHYRKLVIKIPVLRQSDP